MMEILQSKKEDIKKEESSEWMERKERVVCFKCQSEGHIARSCPLNKDEKCEGCNEKGS